MFALLLSLSVKAQTHRFIYDYSFIPNPAKKDSVINEPMALDISEKGSIYQSYNKMRSDFARDVNIKAQIEAA